MLRPLPHWSSTVGEPKLTRMNNFQIRLLVGCDALEQNASRFRTRNNGATPKDPTCKLCNLAVEDADHFVARCPALQQVRVTLLEGAPPDVRAHLPDPISNPWEFTQVILAGLMIRKSKSSTLSFCTNSRISELVSLFCIVVPSGQLSQ